MVGGSVMHDVQCSSNQYMRQQIINYDEMRAIKHIQRHKHDNLNNHNHSLFNESIDILSLFETMKVLIPMVIPLPNDEITDRYMIKYPNCGSFEHNGFQSDFFTIVTLRNTHQIITMFPCCYIDTMNHCQNSIYQLIDSDGKPYIKTHL